MREVCFLIDENGAVVWSDTSDDPALLHDSRSRWEAIWRSRHQLAEIAHSHPQAPAHFSREDVTTMAAIESALGRAPQFSVVSQTAMLRRTRDRDVEVEDEPWWADLLRLASGMHTRRSQTEDPVDEPNARKMT